MRIRLHNKGWNSILGIKESDLLELAGFGKDAGFQQVEWLKRSRIDFPGDDGLEVKEDKGVLRQQNEGLVWWKSKVHLGS